MVNHNEQIVLYQTPDGATALEVHFTGETVWLSQAQMVDLFKKTKQNISLHINNIFKEGELHKDSVVKESLTTAADGKQYRTQLTKRQDSRFAQRMLPVGRSTGMC